MARTNDSGRHGFAFQTGEWRVRHRKLRERLAGSNEWLEFDGTCRAWELLDGHGNVDDHVLEDPGGTYRAATLRRTDATGQWWIWWFDGRFPELGPPVVGAFDGGVGRFHGADTLRGAPIRVRFLWSAITRASARWEQAFSGDDGRTWEVNWTMDMVRTG